MPPSLSPALRAAALPASPAVSDGWHDVAEAAAALVFETDLTGRLTRAAPDPALGWSAEGLIGRPGRSLLAVPADDQDADPFRPDPANPAGLRHRRCWLRAADGGVVCLSLTTLPLRDPLGRVTGLRGLGLDLAAIAPAEAELTQALRQAAVLERLLRGLRVEQAPHRLAEQAVRALAGLLGADGAALIEPPPVGPGLTGPAPIVRPVLGDDPATLAPLRAPDLLAGLDDATGKMVVADGRPLLLCPCPTRLGTGAGLALWRQAGRRRWEAGDLAICTSAMGLLRLTLEQGAVQEVLAARARTDGVTGLANARAFQEEVPRRIDRLDRDRLPGTMMRLTIEGFDRLAGHAGGDRADEALRLVTALLRTTFRPADMLARLGAGTFAIWLDGADEMTAAERADALCHEVPAQLAHLAANGPARSVTIGIAMRGADATEDAEELFERAEQAAARARAAGAPGWRVWHEG